MLSLLKDSSLVLNLRSFIKFVCFYITILFNPKKKQNNTEKFYCLHNNNQNGYRRKSTDIKYSSNFMISIQKLNSEKIITWCVREAHAFAACTMASSRTVQFCTVSSSSEASPFLSCAMVTELIASGLSSFSFRLFLFESNCLTILHMFNIELNAASSEIKKKSISY